MPAVPPAPGVPVPDGPGIGAPPPGILGCDPMPGSAYGDIALQKKQFLCHTPRWRARSSGGAASGVGEEDTTQESAPGRVRYRLVLLPLSQDGTRPLSFREKTAAEHTLFSQNNKRGLTSVRRTK